MLVGSGFVLALFPAVKGAAFPCTSSDRKCHRAIIIVLFFVFSCTPKNREKLQAFNGAKGMQLLSKCLLAFLLLPSYLVCKIESHPSHPLPTGGKVAFKS